MAKQEGLFPIQGTLGNVTFYKSGGEYLARTKGGVSKDRIENDPAFALTRQNGAEFGSAASSGKVLRNSIRPLLLAAKDNSIVFRLTKLMNAIKKLDSVNPRGQRNVTGGLATAAGSAEVVGFDFNEQAKLGSVLYNSFSYVHGTGTLTLAGFDPVNELVPPPGATHFKITQGVAEVSFSDGTYVLSKTVGAVTAIDAAAADYAVVVDPAGLDGTKEDKFVFMLIEFLQEVNRTQYTMKNGSYNVLACIHHAHA